VGTTNVTQIDDYAGAIAPQTAAIMRIHTSNFAVVGHTQETPLAELVPLGRKNNVPIIDDIGNGALIELSRYGIPGEPVAADSIRAGADLVLFSGDKLLGGPPCGVIIGRHSLVQQITEHPLMRACRVDKLTLAALAGTLRLYQDLELAERSVPLLSLLATPLENLRQRAERIAPQIAATGVAAVEIVPIDFATGMAAPPLGIWLVSDALGAPQTFSCAGRMWQLVMRPARYYKPYSVTLRKFTHEKYAGTEIPKNFASRIALPTRKSQ
jgi:L-seryl-tRNA(Ser) seleniumtransferase